MGCSVLNAVLLICKGLIKWEEVWPWAEGKHLRHKEWESREGFFGVEQPALLHIVVSHFVLLCAGEAETRGIPLAIIPLFRFLVLSTHLNGISFPFL